MKLTKNQRRKWVPKSLLAAKASPSLHPKTVKTNAGKNPGSQRKSRFSPISPVKNNDFGGQSRLADGDKKRVCSGSLGSSTLDDKSTPPACQQYPRWRTVQIRGPGLYLDLPATAVLAFMKPLSERKAAPIPIAFKRHKYRKVNPSYTGFLYFNSASDARSFLHIMGVDVPHVVGRFSGSTVCFSTVSKPSRAERRRLKSATAKRVSKLAKICEPIVEKEFGKLRALKQVKPILLSQEHLKSLPARFAELFRAYVEKTIAVESVAVGKIVQGITEKVANDHRGGLSFRKIKQKAKTNVYYQSDNSRRKTIVPDLKIAHQLCSRDCHTSTNTRKKCVLDSKRAHPILQPDSVKSRQILKPKEFSAAPTLKQISDADFKAAFNQISEGCIWK
jgi:hypothetical protein